MSASSARSPGELLCLDTFYIGKLKGVGKVWQVTACDVASPDRKALVAELNARRARSKSRQRSGRPAA